jgi:hypothetical protein
MLFAEDTPANLSAKQVTAKVKKIHATCGLGCATPLARLDPDTQSWKMLEGIFPLEVQPFLPILPPSGMTQNGTLLARKVSARTTVETESLSWPTPTAVTRPMEGNVRIYRAKIQAGEMTEAEAEAILGKSVWAAQGKVPEMWPTPTTQEVEHPNMMLTRTGRRLSKDGESSHSLGLADRVRMSDGGRLNPAWVEWLMGFPEGWTDLNA